MLHNVFDNAIVPSIEIGSYEALWLESNDLSFTRLASKFRGNNDERLLPSALIHDPEKAKKYYQEVLERVKKAQLQNFGVSFRETLDYPDRLNDAKSPLEIIYYAGNWELVSTRSIAIVGSRKPSLDGVKRTQQLTKEIVKNGFTVTSGLAAGVDTTAHETAINEGGNTIAVLGTPLDVTYPKENTNLYRNIVDNHLVISQVPFIKYAQQSFSTKRFYFPERNKTMSAISEATIIVEASETSGTLIQAKAALEQGRKLFILASCFEQGLLWPNKFLAKGAIKVYSMDDIWNNLNNKIDLV